MNELREKIRETIESNDVVVFMKGTPEMVMCGNSERTLHALRAVGTGFTAVDILPDPQIRQELSALSSWPTIPQVFVKGELVGGADITEELAESGELEATLEAKLGPGWRETAGQERAVGVTDRPSPFRIAR
jgi:monothiol glutaredoxin